jgi:hypothetical protein
MAYHTVTNTWLCRPVIDQNFYYAGLKLTGPTFGCAMSNILPAMTFVLAVIFRYVAHLTRLCRQVHPHAQTESEPTVMPGVRP